MYGAYGKQGSAFTPAQPPQNWVQLRSGGAHFDHELLKGPGRGQFITALANEMATAAAVHIRQHFFAIVLKSVT